MVILIPLPEISKLGALWPMALLLFQIRKAEAMAILIPNPEAGWECGHDLCLSSLEEWVSVAMVTPVPFLQGR